MRSVGVCPQMLVSELTREKEDQLYTGNPVPDNFPLPDGFAMTAIDLRGQITDLVRDEPELFTGQGKLTGLGEEVLEIARKKGYPNGENDVVVRLARDARIDPLRLWMFLHEYRLRPSFSRAEFAAIERELQTMRWKNEPTFRR